MKKLIQLFTTLSIVCCIHLTINAQNYTTAAGLRLGYPTSASIKHFINESHAVEAYVGTRGYFGYRWTNISAAYLVHQDIPDVEGLQWYVGGGASLYIWSFKEPGFESFSATTYGIQAYAGLDYALPNTPLNITLDWTPTFFINGYGSGLGGDYGSLGVRYIFNRN